MAKLQFWLGITLFLFGLMFMLILFPGLTFIAIILMGVFGTLGWIYEGKRQQAAHAHNDSFDPSMTRKEYRNKHHRN